MHAHTTPISLPAECNDSILLLDEEFDALDIKLPFTRTSGKDRAIVLCEDEGWDDNSALEPL